MPSESQAVGPVLRDRWPFTVVIGDHVLPRDLVGGVDMILSNPPYVAVSEWEDLPSEVRCEPRGALVAPSASDGTPGGAAIEIIIQGAADWLRHPGVVVIELAPNQAAAALSMAERAGFGHVRIVQDLAERDRVLVGRRA